MRIAALLVPCLLLAACAAPPVDEQRDGPPPRSLDPDSIADAVPRDDPITSTGNVSPYTVLGQTYEVMTEYRGFSERGIASWYGTKFHGRLTSNGEVYDLYRMTAAHRTLPLPVYVRVTNLDNGRSAVVRVNDRGPFHDDRVIDLSYAAAVKLGFADQGTAPVEIEVLDTDNRDARSPLRQTGSHYYLQVAAFSDPERARQLKSRLSDEISHSVRVVSSEEDPVFHRVRIGPFTRFLEAERLRQELKRGPVGETRLVTESKPSDTASR